MKPLLSIAFAIDKFSTLISKVAAWTVLISAAVCCGNAFVRYGIDWSSNSLLELQWYMFAWMVMIGAPYVLKLNEHVRVDLVYGSLKGKGPVWVDLFGLMFFLLPVMGVLFYLSAPYFWRVFVSSEMSPSAGGLMRWPAVLALPVGFGALWLQGVSEIIKRIGVLNGSHQMDLHYEKPVQ